MDHEDVCLRRPCANTGDLKSRIDQIAGDGPARPDDEPAAAATARQARPATDAGNAAPVQPGRPRPGGKTAAASGSAPAPTPLTRQEAGERGAQVTVRVDKEMHAQLKQLARDEERRVEGVVRRTLRKAIAAHEARKAGERRRRRRVAAHGSSHGEPAPAGMKSALPHAPAPSGADVYMGPQPCHHESTGNVACATGVRVRVPGRNAVEQQGQQPTGQPGGAHAAGDAPRAGVERNGRHSPTVHGQATAARRNASQRRAHATGAPDEAAADEADQLHAGDISEKGICRQIEWQRMPRPSGVHAACGYRASVCTCRACTGRAWCQPPACNTGRYVCGVQAWCMHCASKSAAGDAGSMPRNGTAHAVRWRRASACRPGDCARGPSACTVPAPCMQGSLREGRLHAA